MKLKQYFDQERGRAKKLSEFLEIPYSYLWQMGAGERSVSPERAVKIEQATKGQVRRQDLRSDWAEIWPELTTKKKA